MGLAVLHRLFSRSFVLVALCLLAAAPMARAGFIGATVTVTAESPALGAVIDGPDVAPVGPGVEFLALGGVLNADVADTSILITDTTPGNFGVETFSGLHFLFTGAPAITGVTVDGSSTLIPFAVTFDSDEIFFNVSGSTSGVGFFSLLNVTFAQSGPNPVPLPAAVWAGLALGAGVLGRKRLQKA